MQALTFNFDPMIRENDVIQIAGRRLIADAIEGTTITTRRPMLGHYIAWAVLRLWYAMARG
jgi:hypothetical protein